MSNLEKFAFRPVSEVEEDSSLGFAIKYGIISTFLDHGELYYYIKESELIPEKWSIIAGPCTQLTFDGSLTKVESWFEIHFRNGVKILLSNKLLSEKQLISIPVIRSIARVATCASILTMESISWVEDSKIFCSTDQKGNVEEILRQSLIMAHDKTSELTKSAYYMGSKSALSIFLLESLRFVVPAENKIVDLMCGSGSASRAFSIRWRVLACDAQYFCTALATCLGGISDLTADVIELLKINAGKKYLELSKLYADFLTREKDIFHSSNEFEGIRKEYSAFIEQSLLSINRFYGKGGVILDDYNLMTSYFGNVYFGIRQSIEIDCIRYAIEKIDKRNLRDSALAVLVSSVSFLGTGYASQFAQPVRVGTLPRARFYRLMEKRSGSIFTEFFARFIALSKERSHLNNKIESHCGSWQSTISKLKKDGSKARNTCVYLDAPYTRDEYARYYHVLETLCKYNYPSAVGSGLVPDRRNGDLFKSAFFTRSKNNMAPLLAEIISASLEVAECCAWSYSSNGHASILEVLEICNENGVDLSTFYSMPHRHKRQGKSSRGDAGDIKVIEYLFVLRRGRNYKIRNE